MKNISILLMFLTGFTLTTYSQLITGTVTTDVGKNLVDVKIVDKDGKRLGMTNNEGYFEISYIENLHFGFEKKGYESRWFQVSEFPLKPMNIVMGMRYQDVEAVMITRKGMENALDIESVNILDYKPFISHILTLKKKKKTYFIGVDSLGKEGNNYELVIDRPRELFIDCMNNTYVLSDDSAYQVHVAEGQLSYISTISKKMFNKYIASCVSDFGNGLVLQEFTAYNQRYELTLYEDGVAKPFFSKLDSIGYEMAYQDMHSLQIQELMKTGDSLALKEFVHRERMGRGTRTGTRHPVPRPHYSGPTTYGRYDPNSAGQINDGYLSNRRQMDYINRQRELNKRGNWDSSRFSDQLEASFMLNSRPLHIRTFQMGNFMLVVDYDLDSVNIYNNLGEFQRGVNFDVGDEIEDIWKDRSTGFLYLYCKERGSHKIYSLNPLNGETVYVKSFKKAPRTESVQVFDGWVYFRVQENGYFAVKRVRLPEVQYHTS